MSEIKRVDLPTKIMLIILVVIITYLVSFLSARAKRNREKEYKRKLQLDFVECLEEK